MACKHRWDVLGLQKPGTVRTCSRCAERQIKREKRDGFHLVAYWRPLAPEVK